MFSFSKLLLTPRKVFSPLNCCHVVHLVNTRFGNGECALISGYCCQARGPRCWMASMKHALSAGERSRVPTVSPRTCLEREHTFSTEERPTHKHTNTHTRRHTSSSLFLSLSLFSLSLHQLKQTRACGRTHCAHTGSGNLSCCVTQAEGFFSPSLCLQPICDSSTTVQKTGGQRSVVQKKAKYLEIIYEIT